MCEDGYYQNGNTCEICPVGSYCANNTKTACDTGYSTDNTGATSESQCYTTCEVACTQQECPDNATCTHDNTKTTGKQYVGGTCDVEQTTCNINIQCNENFEKVDGACKLIPEFTMTTTNMPANSTFWMGTTAAGTFYLDCGEGGTPVEADKITGTVGESKIATPQSVQFKVYTFGCKYTQAGEHTIHMAGQATKYSTIKYTNSDVSYYMPVLAFNLVAPKNNTYLKSISGSLGHIFGTIDDGSDASKQPSFAGAFSGQTNLVGTIPENLFDGVHGKPINGMFLETFYSTNLQDTIPSGLFKGITGGAEYSFNATFANCPNLITIGDGLFDNITGGAPYMFKATFSGCTGIKSVHEDLFKNITTGADGMFWSTFTNTGLTSVPSKLFQNVRGSALKMFRATFGGATSLTEVPTDLFKNITEPAEELFALTFKGTGLTSIPYGLFAGLADKKPATNMFQSTFENCTNMTGWTPDGFGLNANQGWVPYDMFGGMNPDGYVAGTAMTNVFNNTAIAESCPVNWYKNDIAFDVDWSGKVSCASCPDGYVSEAGSTSESQCYVTCTKQCAQQTCPENSVNCTHGNEISSGRQYYGSSCDATENVCDIDFSCSVGYDKLSFADTLVRNMDAIYDSAEYDEYCQLNNTGNSCDTLSAGQYMWYFDTSYGSPISSGQVQTTCTDDMGNDADPQSRINYNADFDIQSSGANCWERVLYLNDSPVLSSWIYNKTYDSAEDCAAYCGFSKPMSVGYALAVATNANLCAPHEYTVTYDCNDGTGNTTDTATYKTTFTPRKDVCERNGYKFIGWTLNDASVSDSFVWDYTNDQTLIATWEQMSAECKPGEYLPANATECKPCEENNYCPGGTYNIGTTDIGLNPCHDGSMSNSGATHITQCYINKPCSKYTDITTVCTYNTDTNDFTDCAECSIDTSCPYNQELVNGKCAPCNRDNALDYHKTGNCMVSECEQGFYPYMQQCMPEKIECDAPKANVAYKYWDVANRAYGPCIITECIDDEYHIEANACVPNTQSCDVEHGIGEQEWDFEQNKWGTCVATQCDSGYTTDQSLTNDVLNGQCGRCSNMYVDDELAVSTYISECEIASCMYQGEKYILENNECVLICDERSDETGSRYWNGNKCVHECAEGYSIWE
jgi:uncharacterized repeat protein (TIGR02543 family)